MSELEIKPEYYLVSPEHSSKQYVRTFWRPEAKGYTMNLEEAGLYHKDYGYPVVGKDNLKDAYKHDDFLIHKDDITLLGKRMTCILN